MFDLETFAAVYRIDVHYPGEKNVSNGWLNINCPFCLHDKSWHLGMNTSSGAWSCWKCGHKSGPQKVVQALLRVSYNEACSIVDKYQRAGAITGFISKNTINTEFKLPEDVQLGLNKRARQYLQNRGFDPDYIIQEFKVCQGSRFTSLSGRIVIPIIQNRQTVNYVARDYTGRSPNKYVLCSNQKAAVPRNELLYHFDFVKNVGMVVEGPIDVWAIGRGAFATFGTQFSTAQLAMIGERGLSEIYITYDEDALSRARSLSAQLAGIVPHVELIILDKGDPAEQDQSTKEELKAVLRS